MSGVVVHTCRFSRIAYAEESDLVGSSSSAKNFGTRFSSWTQIETRKTHLDLEGLDRYVGTKGLDKKCFMLLES